MLHPAVPKGMSRKLRAQWKGPFLIVFKMSDLNYIVKPVGGHTLKTVHLNKLKPYRDGLPPIDAATHNTAGQGSAVQAGDEPTDMDVTDDNDFEVEAITNKRTKQDGTVEYKLKWKGYPSSQSTWEPETHLACPDLVQKYEQEHSRGGRRPAVTSSVVEVVTNRDGYTYLLGE